MHGQASTSIDGAGRLLKSDVTLPVKIQINTPSGLRGAGPGIYEVVAAHELVHSLGHSAHTTHLMTQTFQKVLGNSPSGDRLQAGSGMLPPIQLSDDSLGVLKGIWG